MLVDVRKEGGKPDRIALGEQSSLTAGARPQASALIEKALQEIHAAERSGDADVGLRAELDHLLGRAGRVIRECDVEDVTLSPIRNHGLRAAQIERRAAIEKELHQRAGRVRLAR